MWEREFCSSVGNISWQRFCENKRYVSILGFGNLEKWDDSGALENFQSAKTRFWAKYHGQPSDIPLPDPDMYIDQIDHHCKVDPKLVAGLDKVGLPVDSDNNSAPVLEWPNAEIYNKPDAVNEWDWEPSPGCNATWGGNNEPSSKWGNNNSGWGAPLEKPSRRGWRNTSMHQTTGIKTFMVDRTIKGVSSRRTINRWTMMRASKGAGGRIL